ncbi:unnamed protein product, partial [Effrenium voratum]
RLPCQLTTPRGRCRAEKIRCFLSLFAFFGQLAHELLQERNAAQAHEDWRRDVTERLQQIRRKPSLNDALNALVYQLKRDNLTEGELFARIDADSDGELSRLELQVALRKLGVSLSTSELDGILRIFDSDGSGST